MANVSNTQMNPLEQLFAFFGQGDSGERGDLATGMTVPTGFNTSNSWSPPTTGLLADKKVGSPDSGLGTGLGVNVGTGQLALSGLGALTGIWNASKQNKLAKEQFNFQKDFATTNLNNQTKTYNTALEDRMTARGAAEGRSADYTANEIARRRLTS